MISNYNVEKIPDSLYGRTYSEFNLEITERRPMCLYLTDAETGSKYVITGLDKLIKSNPYDIGSFISRYRFDHESVFDPVGQKKDLIIKLEKAKEHHDNELKFMKNECDAIIEHKVNQYTYRLFILFLKTITIRSDLKGYLQHDVEFVKNYYDVELKSGGLH